MNITVKGKKRTYKVVCDSRQYMIKEERTVQKDSAKSKKGDKYYLDLAYLPSLESLINKLISMEIKESEAETLKELRDDYQKVTSWVNGLFIGGKF